MPQAHWESSEHQKPSLVCLLGVWMGIINAVLPLFKFDHQLQPWSDWKRRIFPVLQPVLKWRWQRKSCELIMHDFQGCCWWPAWDMEESIAGMCRSHSAYLICRWVGWRHCIIKHGWKTYFMLLISCKNEKEILAEANMCLSWNFIICMKPNYQIDIIENF